MIKRRYVGGFTLVELLVVVAILAVVSTFLVSQYSNVQKTSAERVSIANQEAVNRAVQSFLMLNNGSGLNYLDAVIDWTTAIGAPGTFNVNLSSATTVGGMYRGPKQVSFSNTSVPSESAKAKNHGLYDLDSEKRDIIHRACVYYLSTNDVPALAQIGLTRVVYFNYTTMHPNSRGGLTVTPDMEILNQGPGFRMEHAACFGTPLTNGTAVLALTPCANNLSLYKSFGVPLKTSAGVDPTTDAEAQTAAAGKVLLLFGLGQNASLVGARNGGIDTAPRCEALDYTYYRQYFLVIRCMGGATASNAGAEFAGVLDPKGLTVTEARFSNEWRNGDR